MKRKLQTLLLLTCLPFLSSATDYYWIGGTGNWNDLSHWATTSGGSTNPLIVPSPFDDVYFDANSGFNVGDSVVVNVPIAFCRSMNWTGAANNPKFTTTQSTNQLLMYGSLIMIPNMNFAYDGELTLLGSNTGNTIVGGSQCLKNVILDATGEWILQDSLAIYEIEHKKGILRTNDFPLSIIKEYKSITSTKRILDFGASTVNFPATDQPYFQIRGDSLYTDFDSTTFYFDAGLIMNNSRRIVVNAASSNTDTINIHQIIFGVGTFLSIYPDDEINLSNKVNVNYIQTNNRADVGGSSSFIHYADFRENTFILGDVTYDTLKLTVNKTYKFEGTSTFTDIGAIVAPPVCTGNYRLEANRWWIPPYFQKTQGSIEIYQSSLSYIQTSGGATFTAYNSIDQNGNTGWTFIPIPTGRDLYWVGGNGSWEEQAHWSLTSGGVGGECPPQSSDNVFFDANSGFNVGDSVKVNQEYIFCNNMDWSGVQNNPLFKFISYTYTYIYGSLTFSPNMTYDPRGPIYFVGTNTGNTITAANQHFEYQITFNGMGGSWYLQDSLSSSDIEVAEGSFYSNGNPIRVGRFTANAYSTTEDTIDVKNSNFYIYGGYKDFIINADTANRKIRTNLDNTNFYFEPDNREGYLSLTVIDTANVNSVIFTSNLDSDESTVHGNSKIYIKEVTSYNGLYVNNPTGNTTDNLIHIDTIRSYQHPTKSGYLNKITRCECDYVYLEDNYIPNTSNYPRNDIEEGKYGTVHVFGASKIIDGHYQHLIAENYTEIKTGGLFGGTYVNKATLKGRGLLEQTDLNYPLQFDTLSLAAGQLYEFTDTTKIISWLDAEGSCDGIVTLKSSSTLPFYLQSNADTITVNYGIIENSTAQGTADFVAVNSIDNGGNTGWQIQLPTTRNLYWVGGNGQWTDSTHWALTSGGVGGECPPNAQDNVFFDGNAGFGVGDSVLIDIPIAYCRDMTWTGVQNNPMFLSSTGNTDVFQIYGSLTFDVNMNHQFKGEFRFVSSNTGNTITTATQHFHDDIIFEGLGGAWTLQDSISAYRIYLKEGDLYGNGQSISTRNFYAITPSLTEDTLNLSNSNIYMVGNFEVTADTSNTILTDQKHLRTNFDGANFHFSYFADLNLDIIDTTYINSVYFNATQHSNNRDNDLAATDKVYIHKLESKSSLYARVINAPYPLPTTQLVHIDTLKLFYTRSTITQCDCGYVLVDYSGSSDRNTDIHSGYYDEIYALGTRRITIQNGHFGKIYSEVETTVRNNNVSPFYNGTYVGTATLKNDAHLYQSTLSYPLIFDTLSLNAGQTYTFIDTTTISQNGWLDAVGNCYQNITFEADYYNNSPNYYIKSDADTISVDYVVMEDVEGVGTAEFIAYNSIDVGNNINWDILEKASYDLYWVGGSGNWSDSTHWSFSSGGPGGACLPTLIDDVYFDANSGFTPSDKTVNLDIQTAECRSMDWTGALNNPEVTVNGNSYLDIYGSLTLNQNMDISDIYNIRFRSTRSGNTITAATQQLRQVTFEGVSGSWYLQDSLSVENIYLKEGSFFSNQQPISFEGFVSNYNSTTLDTIDLHNSTLYMEVGQGAMTIVADTSHANPIYHKRLKTNLNGTNILYTYAGYAGSFGTREIYLNLIDSAAINKIAFYQLTGQLGNNVDRIRLSKKVYVDEVILNNYSTIENYGSVVDLYHINNLRLLQNPNFTITNSYVRGCDCESVYGNQEYNKVFYGEYENVHFVTDGEIHGGDFGEVLMEGVSKIYSSGYNYNYNGNFTYYGTRVRRAETKAVADFYQGTLSAPLQFDTLKLFPGIAYNFEDTVTITKNGWLDAIGTGSDPIIVRSNTPGTQATIRALNDTICMNFIFMQDMDTAGVAEFRAGAISVDIINNTGWEFEDCCSTFELSELFKDHDTTICAGEPVDLLVYFGQCDGCTFTWNDGNTDEFRTVSPMVTTTYTVAATRPQGCTSIDTFRVNVEPTLAITLPNDTTVADTLPPFLVTASTGGGTYQGTGIIDANTGEFDPSVAGLGIHEIIYTLPNPNGCISTDTMEIWVNSDTCSLMTQPTLINNYNGFGISCHGAEDGGIIANTTGSTGNYTYTWNTGATTQSITNLSPGTYTVTVVDANNCFVVESLTITEPAALVGSATVTTNYNGFGVSAAGASDGEATVTAADGVTPYSYTWSNNATTATVTGLSAGVYTVTVTDANGCTLIDTVVLAEPIPLGISTTITSDYNGYNVSCNGSSDGVAYVTGVGGLPPYTYTWSSGETSDTARNLSSGVSYVTITDANNAQLIDSVTLTEPTEVSAAMVITTNYNGSTISCDGAMDGGLTVGVTGGVAPYTYAWNNSEITDTISNLGVGNYGVTVTDANGCTDTGMITITAPAALTTTLSATDHNGTNISCNGGNDGAITATSNGGTAPYTYLWSDNQTTITATGLSAGTYTVTVTDANNCMVVENITLTEPSALSASTTVITNYNGFGVSCNGANDGGVSVAAINGTAPYTYLWNTNDTTTILTGIGAGTYTVTVTDANGCMTIENITLTEPNPVVANAVVTNAVSYFGAADGELTASGSNGNAPYTYLWSNNETTATITGLTGGTYSVTVTDAGGCQGDTSIYLLEPTAISTETTVMSNYNGYDISCNGGNDGVARVRATGGIGNYTYQWSNGSIDTMAYSLNEGMHTVTITDGNGYAIQDTVWLMNVPPLMNFLHTTDSVICKGNAQGAIDLEVSGGVGGYSYYWNIGWNTQDVQFLYAGMHTVTVTDGNGCQQIHTVEVVESPLPLLIDTINTHPVCYGDSTGAIDATVTGGWGSYEYEWSTGEQTEDINNLVGQIYTLTVTDALGCVNYKTVNINAPQQLSVNEMTTPVTCHGDMDGSILIVPTGGTGTINHTWDDGSTALIRSNLAGGDYPITLTDAVGCLQTDTISIWEPSPMLNDIAISDVSCNNAGDGQVNVSTSGGNNGYAYLWDDQTTNPQRTALTGGDYTLTVTDLKGCTIVDMVTITNPMPLTITETLTSPNCPSDLTGAITTAISGGTGDYQLLWSVGSIDTMLTGLGAGTYTINVFDENLCHVTETYQLDATSDILVDFTVQDIVCGSPTGSVMTTISGGVAPYSTTWSNQANTPNISNLSGGAYTVYVTDALGCNYAATATVSDISSDVTTYLSSSFCQGGSFMGYTTTGIYTNTYPAANGCDSIVTIDITVLPKPTAPTVVQNTNGDLVLNNLIGGVTVQWYFNNQIIAGANGSSYTPLQSGNYLVILTNNDGCTVASNVFTHIKVATNEVNTIDGAIRLYPNPNNGRFTLDIRDLKESGDYTITITNPLGIKVVENTVYIGEQYTEAFDLSALSAELYFVTITNNKGQRVTKKVMVW